MPYTRAALSPSRLQRAVSDRLRVSYPDMGVDRAFFVEGRSIAVSEGWTLVTGTLLLKAA